MSITTLIVDDEPLARKNLEIMLAPEPDLRLLPSAGNADRAADLIRTKRVDLLFLDIRMPGRSGIDLLRDLHDEDHVPVVVLVTAFHSYALEAFELDARDYLVKPLGEARLQKTLDRVREQLATRRDQNLTTMFRAAVATEPEPRRLVIRVDKDLLLLEHDEIAWVEAADHYLVIHIERGRPILRKTLRDFLTLVPEFVRIHRSILVNPNHVSHCRRLPFGGGQVALRDGTVLDVSRRRWKGTHEILSGREA